MPDSSHHRESARRCRLFFALLLLAIGRAPALGAGSEQGQMAPSASAGRDFLRPAPPFPNTGRLSGSGSLRLFESSELSVPAGLRVVVFAPHPDDETLAAAGLIQRVRGRGGQVRVVFITNGDGYVDGVRHEARGQAPSSKDFIAYGKRRRSEALRAISRLGVGMDGARFFGFPDDGIDDLWGSHWSDARPYRSPHTRLDRPLPPSGEVRDVDYAGVDLEKEIEDALLDWRPDWVLVPDPRDHHPDHCTSGVFVLDVLRRARGRQGHGFESPRVFSYLVHAPDYPASPTWVKEVARAGVGGSPTSMAILTTAQWVRFALRADEIEGKQAALAQYETQLRVMRPFLNQFLTQFELFAELDLRVADTVVGEYAARFGRPR